jgi:glycosyltransferase involved in cell wall biosynthesis
MDKPVSLIISFYNNISLLQMIFASLKRQTLQNFEVIIADDGSAQDVVVKVQELIKTASFKVTHCWHSDNGWQKNIILNKSIVASSGQYLIFIDGDCIPHHKFIEEHYTNRKLGRVICGRRVQLTPQMTQNLSIAKIQSGYLDTWGRILIIAHGIFTAARHIENGIRITNPLVRKLFIKDKIKGIVGCNFSIFKSDIMLVNGFDERFLYPGTGEDTDLNDRLARVQVINLSMKHLLTLFHIHHKQFNLVHEPNLEMWRENNRLEMTYTPYGIKKL